METLPARLLVVDNDLAAAELLRTDLSQNGYSVTAVDRADAALQALETQAVDLVLLGLDRPGLDGYELLSRMKREPAMRGLPVIMVAPEQGGGVPRALEIGADDYIRAPYHPLVLRARIAGVLERRQLRADHEGSLQKLQRLSHDLQEVILPLGISLSSEKNTDRLLEKILLEAKKLCNADAGTLYVRTRDNRLKFSIMLTDSLGIALGGTTGAEIPFPPLRLMDPDTGAPNHRNIASHVALTGLSVNIANIYGSEAFDFTATRAFDQRNNYRSISTLTVPLKNNADEVVAVLQLLNALDPISKQVVHFDAYQQLVVESLGSQAAIVFNNQVLMTRQEELLKFEVDLQIGRQIQNGFLPNVLPSAPGWQIAARFQPAREVAGDFYDAFMLSPTTLGFVIADVCDKGVGAALFMALVRSLIRVYTQQRYSILVARASDGTATGGDAEDLAAAGTAGAAIKQAVTLANEYIGENHLDMNMFATTFAGVLDLESGKIVYVNGGHNPPMILTVAGKIVDLPAGGPAVGMVPGVEFKIGHAQLEPGDLLVCYTDGVTDARDPQGRFFSEARLVKFVEGLGATPAEQVASQLLEGLTAHISTALQFDDITMIIIRRERTSG
jgi:sigma-B regulation protein RsbU (phosphoserine phosphatase)